ncbi:MAG: transglycosylase family protein [Jatrophihabitans sp.]
MTSTITVLNDQGVSTSNSTRRTAVAVAATVGAAAAITALAAPAQAAGQYQVWDRVAHCESTNNWSINTGNGFYGGLQFSSSTWAGYGGHKYAHQANRATRMEQIQVARRVLASQGPGAWPVCGRNAGLSRSNGHATSAKLPTNANSESASHTAKANHKAKHRSTSTSHAKSKSHQAKHASHGTYTVHSGDTLSKIASKKHVHGGWHALYKANKSTVHNPNVIRVGQVLRLP